MEHGSTAATVLLPRLPSKARNLMKASTLELYQLVKAIVDDRRTTGRRDIDAMQVLIDEGDKVDDIVQVSKTCNFLRVWMSSVDWLYMFHIVYPQCAIRRNSQYRHHGLVDFALLTYYP